MPDAEVYARLTKNGPVATITLNRPKALNAFDGLAVGELLETLHAVATDMRVRVVILSGAGRAFCAGGDLRAVMKESPKDPGNYFHRLAGVFHQCILEIRSMPKPVIAAINGLAAGGGFSLALACDMRVMGESAYFRLAYTSQGLCVDGGGTFTLPRLLGMARALEMAFLDEPISAARALELGLTNRVAPDAEVLEAAKNLAERLTKMPVETLGRVKCLFNKSFNSSLEEQLERERFGLAESANAPEGREGLTAFVEKRKPNF